MEENYSSFPDILSTLNQSKSMRPEDDVIELLWQNGHVVLNNQTNRRTTPSVVDPKQLHAHKIEVPREYGEHIENSTNLIREEETAKWFQYLLSDSYEKDFSSDFSFGENVSDSMSKMRSDETTGDRYVKFGATKETNAVEDNRMPPPVWQANGAGTGGGLVNFPHFSRSMKGDTGDHCLRGRGIENVSWRELGKCSSRMTEVSSSCRTRNSLLANGLSHEVNRQLGNVPKKSHCGRQTGTRDITTTATSSSGGSGSSIGRTVQQSTGDRRSHKRKGRCIEESECQSEEAELQSVNASKRPQKSTSARRSRSAEVHNLSERRRRDRINEKMKALQELIPNCNKTDKASMLDEAIEYLKSLQLQVQIMWMGNGIAPVMFPNIQHYLPSMGMGMGHSSISTLPNTLRMAQALVNQSMSSMNVTNQASVLSHATQMHNANIPDACARCLGFNHMQPPPEAINFLTSYGPQFQKMLSVNGNQIGESAVPSDNIGNGITTGQGCAASSISQVIQQMQQNWDQAHVAQAMSTHTPVPADTQNNPSDSNLVSTAPPANESDT